MWNKNSHLWFSLSHFDFWTRISHFLKALCKQKIHFPLIPLNICFMEKESDTLLFISPSAHTPLTHTYNFGVTEPIITCPVFLPHSISPQYPQSKTPCFRTWYLPYASHIYFSSGYSLGRAKINSQALPLNLSPHHFHKKKDLAFYKSNAKNKK